MKGWWIAMAIQSLAASLLLGPSSASADEVFLKGGGRLQGIVVEEDAKFVVVEMGPGRVTIPRSRVQRIVSSTAALATYRKRASGLSGTDTAGWLELGLWAQERLLTTQAREAFERVLALDASNEIAQRALGNEVVDGRWLSREEAMRARGLLEFEGRWITREEREAALQERAAEQAARSAGELAERQRAEAEARVREAEARAREAEARAKAAEAEAEASKNGGIPIGTVGWGAGVVQPCCGRVHAPGSCPSTGVSHPRPRPRPTPHPTPTPTPKPPLRDGTREIKPKLNQAKEASPRS